MKGSRFNLHNSKNFAFPWTYFYIKKRDILFIGLTEKLNTRIKLRLFKKKVLPHHASKNYLCIWAILGVVTVAFPENLSQTCPRKDTHMVVPIAASEMCCLILLLNSKKFFFNTNLTILTKSFVGIDYLSCLCKASLRALNSDSWGIVGYNPITSAVTKE